VTERPPVAVTCGDPSGIGPEISVGAWRALGVDVAFFVIGDPTHFPSGTPLAVIDDPSEAPAAAATGLPVLPHAFPALARPGKPTPANAPGVVEVIRRAVDLTASGKA
jgi:4-hydroxythreonine-4-phosphate dehydrogenase